MSLNIISASSERTNKSDRHRYIPEVIVNHITDGSAKSCIQWFNDPNNKNSSTHFLVDRSGAIYQFVAIEDNAWANGLTADKINKSTNAKIKSRGVNPNWYSVSIEHEGVYAENHGELTEAQYQATLMLHKHIIAYVKEKFHFDIIPNRDSIFGHFDISPIEKPNCPGEKFPFDRLIHDLNSNANPQPTVVHWAEESFNYLNGKGIEVKERRFDNTTSRGECIVLMARLHKALKG